MATTPVQAPRKTPDWLEIFLPNRVISPMTMRILIVIQIAFFLLLWLQSPFKVLPRPGEVLAAFPALWNEHGLGHELITSFGLNVRALLWSAAISLGLSYLTVIPFFRPLASAASKGRFLSLVGFSLVFTLMLGQGSQVKLALLVVGMTFFFLTSMMSEVASIPREKFDHARTIGMSEWRVVWEVVILGTKDKALEVMRQNAAIGWMMLTMVEGISRSEGGVGVLLMNLQKYAKYADVFAIQLAILIVGLFQDYLLGLVRRVLCPYAYLTLERRSG
jgi:NitT/TauT family transport system permease protein